MILLQSGELVGARMALQDHPVGICSTADQIRGFNSPLRTVWMKSYRYHEAMAAIRRQRLAP